MPRAPTNYVRRATGAIVCAAPIWLAMASVVDGVFGKSSGGTGGIGWFVFAGVIVAVNAYRSFLRPRLYAHRHNGSMEGFRSASGIPLLGSVAVVLGIILSWGHTYFAIVGAVLSVADTGGAPAFLIVTWHDRTLWGEQSA